MNDSLSRITQEEYKHHPLFARLLELHNIPKEIFYKGTLPNITIDEYGRATPRLLTVIGSRKYTQYGKHALEKLLGSLKGEDVIIVSGLAYGLDILSHLSALKNNVVTIAIPGSGLSPNVIYPRAHANIAQEIVDAGGLLLSELPPETKPALWTFPSRNRIMAALSDAVLVIEAEEKSGTLITARQALELGRDIGAIPGDIFSPTSLGTNMLIHEGAYPITNEDDLFALLHLSKNEKKVQNETYTEDEQCIIDILKEVTEKDTLLIKSELPLERFLTAFSSLEIKGCIEETFGEVRRLV